MVSMNKNECKGVMSFNQRVPDHCKSHLYYRYNCMCVRGILGKVFGSHQIICKQGIDGERELFNTTFPSWVHQQGQKPVFVIAECTNKGNNYGNQFKC